LKDTIAEEAFTFVTNEVGVKVPEWLLDKWKHTCMCVDGCFPMASSEGRTQAEWSGLEQDFVKFFRDTPASRSPGELWIAWLGDSGDVLQSHITGLGIKTRRIAS
jgi:hypothetical protein